MITFDENVARLAGAHPALFETLERMPFWSALADGWYELVDSLCMDIERELGPELCRDFTVEQIKEKYGTLRFYWKLGAKGDVHLDAYEVDAEVISAVSMAEPSRAKNAAAINRARERVRALVKAACDASGALCQHCGAPGVQCRNRAGWLFTLCDEHRRQVAEEAKIAHKGGA